MPLTESCPNSKGKLKAQQHVDDVSEASAPQRRQAASAASSRCSAPESVRASPRLRTARLPTDSGSWPVSAWLRPQPPLRDAGFESRDRRADDVYLGHGTDADAFRPPAFDDLSALDQKLEIHLQGLWDHVLAWIPNKLPVPELASRDRRLNGSPHIAEARRPPVPGLKSAKSCSPASSRSVMRRLDVSAEAELEVFAGSASIRGASAHGSRISGSKRTSRTFSALSRGLNRRAA